MCNFVESELGADSPGVHHGIGSVAAKPVRGGVVHRECDSFFAQIEGLNDVESALVKFAAKTKPNIRPHSSPGCISMLHRELSCTGFKAKWEHVLELLPNQDDEGLVFGDIGSGYGQVCFMAMLLSQCGQSWGIEVQEDLHCAAQEWQQAACASNSTLKLRLQNVKFVNADISKLTGLEHRLLNETAVLFCNNPLFGAMEAKYKRCDVWLICGCCMVVGVISG